MTRKIRIHLTNEPIVRKICCNCKYYFEFKRDDITSYMCACKKDEKRVFPVEPAMEACEYFEVKE